jgi:tetratricopeptide (TPR) repeat protein
MRTTACWSLAVGAALMVVALAHPAHAETPTYNASEESVNAEARGAFEAGRSAYDQGRFGEALEHFEHAYDLSARRTLLYNIGRAAEGDGQTQRAIEAYEGYLRAAPAAEHRRFAENRIAKLRASLAYEGGPARDAPFASARARVAKSVQLSLALNLFDWSHVNQELKETDSTVEQKRTGWGLNSSTGIEGGYALNENLLLGAKFDLGGYAFRESPSSAPSTSTDSTWFALGPKAQWMFAPWRNTRPFLDALVALEVASDSSSDTAAGTQSRKGLILQLRGGLHIFVADTFSIDPGFFMGGTISGGSFDKDSGHYQASVRSFSLGFDLLFTGWINRKP